jgi:hypothetical protein
VLERVDAHTCIGHAVLAFLARPSWPAAQMLLEKSPSRPQSVRKALHPPHERAVVSVTARRASSCLR